MRLMCDLELDYDNMSKTLGIDFREYFKNELTTFKEAADDNLVSIDQNKLVVSPLGRLIIRNLAMRFDAYSKQNLNRFSKTI